MLVDRMPRADGPCCSSDRMLVDRMCDSNAKSRAERASLVHYREANSNVVQELYTQAQGRKGNLRHGCRHAFHDFDLVKIMKATSCGARQPHARDMRIPACT